MSAGPLRGPAGRVRANGRWRPLLLVAAISALAVLAVVFDVGDQVVRLRGWIDGLGPLGPLAFALIYVLAVVAVVPASAMTVLAGALFGSVTGVILVSVSSTVGASLSFLISRHFARDAAARWLEHNATFKRIDRLTAERGAIVVALTRLVPLFPFNLLNYGFGLTRVRFWTYVLWSWLCMLPATVLYVAGADAVTRALTEGRVPRPLVLGLTVGLAVLVVLVRQARRRLHLELPTSGKD